MQLKPRAAGWAVIMVIVLFLGGVLGFWAFDYSQRRTLASSRTAESAIAAGFALTRQLYSVFSDLAYLSQQPDLIRFRLGLVDDRSLVEASWGRYLDKHPYLEQIRYLDSTGLEQLRVERGDGGPVVIPVTELQDKSSRYYFLDALELAPGQIYLSPIDLNVEHGAYELPLRPMMRFVLRTSASPSGENPGFLVLNVDADYLLHPLIRIPESGAMQLLLADADGRLLLDESGQPYWRKGEILPTTQLATGLLYDLPQQELYTQVRGNQFITRLRVSPRNSSMVHPPPCCRFTPPTCPGL